MGKTENALRMTQRERGRARGGRGGEVTESEGENRVIGFQQVKRGVKCGGGDAKAWLSAITRSL